MNKTTTPCEKEMRQGDVGMEGHLMAFNMTRHFFTEVGLNFQGQAVAIDIY